MPLVPAKCLECGGNIVVDNEKEAWICDFCKTPFVVEKAINNFNTINNITNHNEIKADVVNVYDNTDNIDNLFERAKDYIKNNNYDEAERVLNKILDLDINHRNAKQLLNDLPNLQILSEKSEELIFIFENLYEVISGKSNDMNFISDIRVETDDGCFLYLIKLYQKVVELGGDLDGKYKENIESLFKKLHDLAMDETWCKVTVLKDTFSALITKDGIDEKSIGKMKILSMFLIETVKLTEYYKNHVLNNINLKECTQIIKCWLDINVPNRLRIMKQNGEVLEWSVLGYYAFYYQQNRERVGKLYKLGDCIDSGVGIDKYLYNMKKSCKEKRINLCIERRICPACGGGLSVMGKCVSNSCRNHGKKIYGTRYTNCDKVFDKGEKYINNDVMVRYNLTGTEIHYEEY